MASQLNLTQASIMSRKGIRFAIYALVAIIIARFIFIGVAKLYRATFPPAPPKPAVKFEKLPAVPFPDFDIDRASKLNYTLETISGSLPEIEEQAIVYFMPKTPASILSLDRARETASKLGFGRSDKELVKTVYEFTHPTNPSILNMNIINGIFSISYDLNADPQVFAGIPPTVGIAGSQARALLKSANLLPVDIEDGPTTHQFLRISEGRFVKAESLKDANFTKVNLYRTPYQGYKGELSVVTTNFEEANIWFIFASDEKKNGKVIAGEYHYFPIDINTSSTYPTKTAEEAWGELQGGVGFIANFGENSDENITIRDIYLAYFDPGQYSEFFQPVYVFEGSNGFVAYVPAIANEFYGADIAK